MTCQVLETADGLRARCHHTRKKRLRRHIDAKARILQFLASEAFTKDFFRIFKDIYETE